MYVINLNVNYIHLVILYYIHLGILSLIKTQISLIKTQIKLDPIIEVQKTYFLLINTRVGEFAFN